MSNNRYVYLYGDGNDSKSYKRHIKIAQKG